MEWRLDRVAQLDRITYPELDQIESDLIDKLNQDEIFQFIVNWNEFEPCIDTMARNRADEILRDLARAKKEWNWLLGEDSFTTEIIFY